MLWKTAAGMVDKEAKGITGRSAKRLGQAEGYYLTRRMHAQRGILAVGFGGRRVQVSIFAWKWRPERGRKGLQGRRRTRKRRA